MTNVIFLSNDFYLIMLAFDTRESSSMKDTPDQLHPLTDNAAGSANQPAIATSCCHLCSRKPSHDQRTPYLSDEEVQDMTRSKRPSKQQKVLDKLGIAHYKRQDNTLLVLRRDCECAPSNRERPVPQLKMKAKNA